MRDEKSADPRRMLCEKKFFGLRPQPLEQYLYRLKLPQSAERVFWLHWDLGYRQGNFVSEIAVSEVARRICCDASSVVRAYQRLKSLGLLRRQDPGRDPQNPYRQAIAVTEILLPREALSQLMGGPDRRAPVPPPVRGEVCKAEVQTPVEPSDPTATDTIKQRYGFRAMRELLKKMSLAEREAFLRAQKGGGSFEHLPDSRLDEVEYAWLLGVLQPQPHPHHSNGIAAVPGIRGRSRRSLNAFCLASLRKQLSKLVQGPVLDERFREVVWAVEEGALARFEVPLAINIALKKLRESQWSRPHRMPPNWRRAVA